MAERRPEDLKKILDAAEYEQAGYERVLLSQYELMQTDWNPDDLSTRASVLTGVVEALRFVLGIADLDSVSQLSELSIKGRSRFDQSHQESVRRQASKVSDIRKRERN